MHTRYFSAGLVEIRETEEFTYI